MITLDELRRWETELTLDAQGLIGGTQDFIDWAQHRLADRVPLGFKLEVEYYPASPNCSSFFKLRLALADPPPVRVFDRRTRV